MMPTMTTKNSKRVVIRGLSERDALEIMVQASRLNLPEGVVVALEDESEVGLTGGGDPDPPPPPPKKP